MNIFIDPTHSISISYLEFGKFLVLLVESIIEVSYGLSLLTLFYL